MPELFKIYLLILDRAFNPSFVSLGDIKVDLATYLRESRHEIERGLQKLREIEAAPVRPEEDPLVG